MAERRALSASEAVVQATTATRLGQGLPPADRMPQVGRWLLYVRTAVLLVLYNLGGGCIILGFLQKSMVEKSFVQNSMVRQQKQCFVVAFRWKFSRSPQTVLGSKRVTLANIRSLSTRQTRSGYSVLRLRSRFSTRSFTPPGTYAPILPGCSASQP